jgi:hypothetical protein
VVAVLRRQRARLNLELLHRVRKRQRQGQVVVGIVVRAPVEHVGHAVRQASRDDNCRAGITPNAGVERARTRGIAAAFAASREAGLEDQLGELSTVQRQLEHLLVRDDLTDARVACLDERRAPLHRDGFLQLAELERHRERRVGADLHHDAGLHIRAEALKRGLKLVRTDRQILEHVRAGVIGHDRTNQARVGLGHGHGHTWKRSAALVLDGAVQLRGRLCPRAARDQ